MFCHHLSAYYLSGFGRDDKGGGVGVAYKETHCLITFDTRVSRHTRVIKTLTLTTTLMSDFKLSARKK